MSLKEPGGPRELGEHFRFIAEVTGIFPEECFEESSDRLNLVSSAGKFGIIFVANQSCIKVFRSNPLIDQNDKTPITTITGRGLITHITTSCDGQTLFVVAIVNYSPLGFLYDLHHILQNSKDHVPFYSTPLSTDIGSRVASLSWNPCDPACIAVALSTGDLSLLKIKESSVEFINKNGLGANAVTWSAKGKQLAVGKKDGTLTLFKPDLTLVRSVEVPAVQGVGPVIDITWFTNTEFFVGYLTMDNLPALFYVNAPKGKPAIFVNFEDICYSSESGRPVSYYSVFISEWNLLFVFSSNGVEMGLIGKTQDESSECKWCQWFPDDGAGASMHFCNVTQETYPLGLAVDFTSQKTFPPKDEKQRGPFPALLTISTKGEFNVFFIENKLSEVQNLNISCDTLPLTSHRTPEQFGQPANPVLQTTTAAPPPVELKKNSLSAFSSIPKKSDGEAASPTLFTFSTPLKPISGDSSQLSKVMPPPFTPPTSANTFSSTASSISFQNLSSNTFSFTPANTPHKPSFSSSFVQKPVSLSNQIGGTSLHIPSPKKSTPSQGTLPAVVPPQTPPLTSQPISATPQPVNVPSKVSKESVIYRIEKEQQQFMREMRELCSTNDALEYKVGTEKEDTDTRAVLEEVKEWMAAMKKNTEEQSEEVGHLHQKTLEALASYEDANSHRQIKFSSRNQVYLQLRPLDPYSQRKLDEVRSKYQYLVSQISEVNAKLDLQWEEYAAQKKPKKVLLEQRSATENLYRSVLNLHNMRLAAEKEVDNIVQQLKKLSTDAIYLPSSSFSSFDETASYFRTIHRPNHLPQSPSQSKISPRRNRILKEILAQRIHTPVRIHAASENSKSDSESSDGSKEFGLSQPEIKGSLESSVDTFKHSTQQNGAIGVVYEDISPPRSPTKTSASASNPLAALSSLVGQVSETETLNLSTRAFSYSDTFGAGGLKTESSSCSELGNMHTHSLNKPVKSEVAVDNKDSSSFRTSTLNVPALPGLFLGSSSPFSGVQPFQINLKPTSGQSQPNHSQSPSVTSSDLFSSNKVALQGFGSIISSSLPSNSVKGTATILSTVPSGTQEATSPLVGMLNTNKSVSDSVSSSSLNFTNFFKGSATSASVTSTFTSLFSPPVVSYKSEESSLSSTSFSGEKSLTPSNATMFKVPSNEVLTTSVSPLKREANSSVGNVVYSPTFTSDNLSTSKEAGNVLTSNPILSAQILKETSAISAAGQSAMNNVQSLGLFGQLAASSGTFSLGSSSSPSLNNIFAQGTTSSSSLTASKTSPLIGLPATGSAFSQPVTSTSVFDQPTSSASAFGQPVKGSSVFGQPVTSSSVFGQAVTSSSIFGQAVTSSSIFGQAVTSSSIFGQAVTSSSIFGQAVTSSSIFGQAVTSSSIFGQPVTSSSVFGQPVTSSSVFGQPVTSSSVFGQPVTSSSVFGQPVTSSSVFGQPVTSSSMFGQPVTSSSMFGQPVTSSSMFGQPVTSSPMFGQPVTSSPMFGQPVTSSPMFGQPVTSSPMFGQPVTSSPMFGQPVTSSPMFGQPVTSSSMFGQPVTSSSMFGQPVTSSSIFGQAVTSSSIFGQAVTSSSIFGQAVTSSSIFGQAVTSSSIFGQAVTSSSIFGRPVTSTSAFGQPSSSPSAFGQPSSSPSAFGQPSSSPSAFGQPSSSPSAFAQPSSSPSAFAQPSSSPSAFAQPSSSPSAFAQPSSSPSAFAQPSSSPSAFAQPASSPSAFAQPASSPSAFAQPASSPSAFAQPASSPSAFAQPASSPSAFAQPASSPSAFAQPASSPSAFAQPASSPSAFAQPASSPSAFAQPASSPSAFAQPASSPSAFAQPASSPSAFAQPASSPSAFAQPTSSASIPCQATICTSSTTQTTASSSLFSSASATPLPFANTTMTTSLFSQAPITSSLFGQTSIPAISSLFGQTTITSSSETGQTCVSSPLATNSLSAFGQVTSSTGSLFGKSSGSSIFGQSNSAQSPTTSTPVSSTTFDQGGKVSSAFGQVSNGSSLFGNASSSSTTLGTATTTSQSIFGEPSTSSQSLFGKTTSETPQSSFSQVTSGASVFGSSSPSQSIFGSAGGGSAFQSSSFGTSSVFGQPLSATSTSGTSSTVSSASLFNSGTSGVFGSSTSSPAFGRQTASPFGQVSKNATGSSVFSNVGAQTPSTGTIFGGTTTNTSSFGFGQNVGAASPFSGGNLFSGLGKAPSEEDATKNVFGAVKAGTSPQTNIFGGGNSSSLYGVSTPQKSAGAFSPVKSEGPAFGSSPTFGGSPGFAADASKSKTIFGGGAVFGGSPTLGSGPSFGGSPSMFGGNTSAFSPSTSSGFGNLSSSGSTTFGSLATQAGSSEQTGFGQLSQQAGGGINSTFGGNSFTNWR